MLLCWMTKDSGSLQSTDVCSPFTVMGCGVEALSGLWWFQTRSGADRSVFPGRGVPHTPLILTDSCEAAVTRHVPLPLPPLHQMIASPVLRSLQLCTCSRQTPQLSENEHFITERVDQRALGSGISLHAPSLNFCHPSSKLCRDGLHH